MSALDDVALLAADHRAGFLVDPDNKYPMFNGQWMAENQPNTGAIKRTAEQNAVMDYGKRTPVHEAAIYELSQKIKHLEELLPS